MNFAAVAALTVFVLCLAVCIRGAIDTLRTGRVPMGGFRGTPSWTADRKTYPRSFWASVVFRLLVAAIFAAAAMLTITQSLLKG